MIDVKKNFTAKHTSLKCRLGCETVENMEHLVKCEKIRTTTGGKESYDEEKLNNGTIREKKEQTEILVWKLEEREKMSQEMEIRMKVRKRKTEKEEIGEENTRKKRRKNG